MKEQLVNRILLTVAMAAVLIYSSVNYFSGNFRLFYYIVCLVLLVPTMINQISMIVKDLKKKRK